MMKIALSRFILILLVLITWGTINFAFESWELLSNDMRVEGETTISLKIMSNIDLEDIREIVYKASQRKIQRIDISVSPEGDEDALVRTIFMDTNSRQELITILQDEYDGDIIVLGAMSIGGDVSIEVRYKILIILGIAVIVIFVLFVLYIKTTRKRKVLTE